MDGEDFERSRVIFLKVHYSLGVYGLAQLMLLGGRCVTLRFCSVMSSQKMGVDGFAVLRLRVSR